MKFKKTKKIHYKLMQAILDIITFKENSQNS